MLLRGELELVDEARARSSATERRDHEHRPRARPRRSPRPAPRGCQRQRQALDRVVRERAHRAAGRPTSAASGQTRTACSCQARRGQPVGERGRDAPAGSTVSTIAHHGQRPQRLRARGVRLRGELPGGVGVREHEVVDRGERPPPRASSSERRRRPLARAQPAHRLHARRRSSTSVAPCQGWSQKTTSAPSAQSQQQPRRRRVAPGLEPSSTSGIRNTAIAGHRGSPSRYWPVHISPEMKSKVYCRGLPPQSVQATTATAGITPNRASTSAARALAARRQQPPDVEQAAGERDARPPPASRQVGERDRDAGDGVEQAREDEARMQERAVARARGRSGCRSARGGPPRGSRRSTGTGRAGTGPRRPTAAGPERQRQQHRERYADQDDEAAGLEGSSPRRRVSCSSRSPRAELLVAFTGSTRPRAADAARAPVRCKLDARRCARGHRRASSPP